MSPHRRFVVAIGLLLGVTIVGTAGFALIEGWPLNDSLYMAVITISTVGYGEVQALSAGGRLFTTGLIVVAIVVIWYSATSLVAYLLAGAFLPEWRRRRMERAIRRLTGHYIVCGAGKFGREVAAELASEQVPFVMVDQDPEHCECAGDESLLFVQGNAEEDETLLAAGIERGYRPGVRAAQRRYQRVRGSLRPAAQSVAENRLAGDRAAYRPQAGEGGRRQRRVPVPEHGTPSDDLTAAPVADPVPGRGAGSGAALPAHRRGGRAGPFASGPGPPCEDSRIGDQVGAVIVAIHGRDAIRTPEPATSTAGVTIRPGDSLVAVGSEAQLTRLREFVDGAG